MLNRPVLIVGLTLVALLILCGVALVVGGAWYVSTQPAVASVPLDLPATGTPAGPAFAPPAVVKAGAAAPDFTLTDTNGKTVKLSEQRGKVVVINFWATWCGPCRAEMPTLDKIRGQYEGRPVVILGVNVEESPNQVRGYADIYHLNFTLLLDGDGRVSNAYKVQALPTTFFVDPAGVIRNIAIGGPMSEIFLQRQIDTLLDPSKATPDNSK